MRENIGLFRGKRICTDGWVEGSLHIEWGETTSDGYREKDYRILGMRGECYYVDPETVGECTGLKDKNGKLAFEHDVTEDQWGRRWIIFGCEGGFGICRDTEWTRNADCSVIIWNALADTQNAEWFSKQNKIIGNIHDNPELLKEGAD